MRQKNNDGNKQEVKRYYYNRHENKEMSSGDIYTDPDIYYNDELRNYCPDSDSSWPTQQYGCDFDFQKYKVFSTSTLNSLYNIGGNNIFYKYVSESLGGDHFENGIIEHEFIINRSEYARISYGDTSFIADFGSDKWSNTDWNHGLEKETGYFRGGDLKKLRKTERLYIRKGKDTRRFHNIVIANLFNIKNTCSEFISNPMVNRSVGYWYYDAVGSELSKEIETQYPDHDSLITVKEYLYSDPLHYQLTKEKVTTSENAVSETTYAYAHEKNNQLLIGKNMIGIPLETTTVQKQSAADPGKTVAKTEVVYPASLPTAQAGSLVVPLSSKSMDKLTGTLSTDVSYDKYDEKGNILQYTGRDGLVTSIVWGYNKTQPIAKIEGMTYENLLSLASPAAIISASDEDAADPSREAQLLEALNTFRKNSQLADKKVTTYTYDPLIGVTSITPPSGIRQSFSYDAANRLKETKVRGKNPAGTYTDQKAAEYRYNYKP